MWKLSVNLIAPLFYLDELMIPYENLEVTEETLGTKTFGVVINLGTEVAIKKIKMDEDMKLKTHLEVQIMRLACTKEKGQTKYKAHKQ